MITSNIRSTMLVCGMLFGVAGTPAYAAPFNTDAFLANVTANVDFLDRSSRLALENSKSVKLRDYARNEARDQTLAANALYDLTSAGAANVLQTGRSVAAEPSSADNRLPLGQEDLDSIEGLNGIEFDEAYRAKQRDALIQVRTDYESYIAKGLDGQLKAFVERELVKVNKQLTSLEKV